MQPLIASDWLCLLRRASSSKFSMSNFSVYVLALKQRNLKKCSMSPCFKKQHCGSLLLATPSFLNSFFVLACGFFEPFVF